MIEAGKVSVVLVDDSVDVRTLVRMRLESSGLFDVKGEAADGEQAIALVIRHEPALVLLDVSMPSMDGLETLPSILAVRPETAVVMFSGFGGTHLTTEVRELGAIDFIEKSIPLEQLPERLFQSLLGTSPKPVVPSPSSSTSPPDTPAELLEAGADTTRIEQEILDEHLEGFHALFDRAAIGMATLTVHATIVRANDALADLMSCEPSELVGVDYGRLTGGQGDVLDSRLEALRTSQENVATFEHRIPGPPGASAVRIALVTLVPIRDSGGQMLYGFAQVQDISAQRTVEDELHRTEEKFRLLVAAVEEYAVFMLDTRGRVMSWNAGARRIKGYDADEIIGSDFRVFYPEEQQLTGHPQRNLEAALRDGSFAEEGWRVRQDGTRFWASVVISPVHDDRGLHVGFAKVTRDQTEQRQNADDRLEAMAEQARLLAVTAHELRNPTAVIDGSAHALQVSEGRMAAGERDQLFRGIRSSAERLRRLAADLTAASQLQGSGMEFRTQSVSLPELVRGAAARREAASPTAHVGVDVPDGAVLQADEVRLAQAVDNLLDNAIRHGAPPFTMGAQVRGDHVELRVSDAGRGVPDELVSRLFDRFAAAGATSGTGLGLYLVREIARGHGGEVVYEPPADDSPTTFLIRVPVAAAST
ncbi:PAS domain S-box protein [Nocardioides cavernae]|uniref:Sensor-like histidine kinase SenX3 n=1 Tax=Nocardioides cavernae TaxID=1921566 RepID=A0ABR8NDP0_9ACTN|nr:PAS domain S-box protein [Nocardioides cavernae]MBD3925786.1 PAS domain S-box protein [Nocardioides cavernae]MBM7513371.1 PAS domain S-box-containing protein [Nocardioides cavernae]